jgi:hypothetical protein
VDFDLLLAWLSHVGKGSWGSFRQALSTLQAADDEGQPIKPWVVASRLSELGHVSFEFPSSGGGSWRCFRPVLGGLATAGTAVLTGARTPGLVERIDSACASTGARVERVDIPGRPTIIRVIGPELKLDETAMIGGTRFVPELAVDLCRTLNPVSALLNSAAVEAAPVNWETHFFDVASRRWRVADSEAALRTTTAFEFRPAFGGRRYFVRDSRRGLLRMRDRSEAAYAAALLNREAMLGYDGDRRVLSVPIGAPLPQEMARAAVAATGTPPSFAGQHLRYNGVSASVAGPLLAAAGQRPPRPNWT